MRPLFYKVNIGFFFPSITSGWEHPQNLCVGCRSQYSPEQSNAIAVSSPISERFLCLLFAHHCPQFLPAKTALPWQNTKVMPSPRWRVSSGTRTAGARSVLVVLAIVANVIVFHFAPAKTDGQIKLRSEVTA